MVRLFLITYDLHSPEQNYTGLYEAIKGVGSSWAHPMESMWVVKSLNVSQSAEGVYNTIKNNIDKYDSLFVVDITDCNRQGWLPKSFWEWLKNN